MPAIESRSPKAPKSAEGDGSHLGWKETQSKLAVPGARFPNRNGAVKIADHFANGGYHIGRVAPGPDDERRPCVPLLRDREERRGFRIFTERKVFSIRHDAHDLDRHTGAVLEIASDGVLGVEESPGELLIHNGNSRGLRQCR